MGLNIQKNLTKTIFIFEIGMLVVLLVNIFYIQRLSDTLYAEKQNRFAMLANANELRQSSDKLTDLARSFVVSGDTHFNKEYFDLLDIRSGKLARPLNYDMSYWDLDEKIREQRHPKQEKNSLDNLMSKLPYTQQEKNLLLNSEKYSNDLVKLELQAFELMKTLNPHDMQSAIALLHSKAYHDFKTKIMEPIDQFILLLDKRAQESTSKIKSSVGFFYIFLYLLILIFIVGNLYIYLYLKNKNKNLESAQDLLEDTTEKKELFRTIFDKSTDGILIIENDVIVDCNDSAVNMLQYTTKEQFLNTHPSQISPKIQPDGRSSFEREKENTQIVLEKGHHAFEWVHQKADGTSFWVDVVLTDISVANKSRMLVIWRDIDRKKALEAKMIELKDEAINANKAKSEFLANMSHEIRTPLNAILGFVDILKEESRGRKSQEYVNIIDTSSKNLLQIIEDILDFSKIESGKINIDKIDFNTRAELESINNLFDAKCLEKHIKLSLILDDNLPKVINTDPYRVKQVISNLLSNAIKFTSNGKNITVDVAYKENLLHVSVKDEGKGIASDKLSHIFESFSQEDNSTTREFGGTGLGLSISSALVEILGGELKVKSEVGVGSEFYFSIPVEIGKESIKIQEDFKDLSFDGKKILLVEDNKVNQMVMELTLKKLNLIYDIANDGLEAVEAFKKERYDLILMDENMPNMNGIEATKQILAYEKENNLKHTPIIALTANAMKGDREMFLEAGMDEYLSKPLKKKTLANMLNSFLKINQ